MINVIDKRNCCGCGACVQICPRRCITLKSDNEGFDYPVVEIEKCINCGLCESVCPILNADRKKQTEVISTYAAYLKDNNIRMHSSSGGVFSALADVVLESSGSVFGAAFDDEFLVHHICVGQKDYMWQLRGSKYLQSRIEETYMQARNHLENGKLVLFTGTGCQIAGLKRYLQKDYENLLTIDILCHGVPSPKVWKRYLKWQESLYGETVQRTFFRKKDGFGWKKFALSLEFSNNKTYERMFKEDPYMQMFLRNICLRPSCYDCKYKTVNSQADITLGDCWGIDKYMPELDDDKGMSVVFIHTKKGLKYLKQISDEIVTKAVDLEKVSQTMIYKSVREHPRRDRFFQDLSKGKNIDDLFKITLPTTQEKVIGKIRKIVRF